MFQNPILNDSLSYGKGFLTTDCATLYPFSEVVLHDNDILVAVFSRFEWTRQIYGDSLNERWVVVTDHVPGQPNCIYRRWCTIDTTTQCLFACWASRNVA